MITFDEGTAPGDIISIIYSVNRVSHSIDRVFIIKKANGITIQRDITYIIGDPARLINYFNDESGQYEETNLHYTENQIIELKIVFVSKSQAELWHKDIRPENKKKILSDILKMYKRILNK